MNLFNLILKPLMRVFPLVFALWAAAGQPEIPVGLDAYRQWERWPAQRIGERAYMRSTYDRTGGNEGGDASHFLYQQADDFNVTLDVAGPGVLYFARYNHWHGSPWHYEVDGVDHLVCETGTADPVNAKKTLTNTVFIPEAPFPNPLAWTWTTTQGADLMWVPLPFEKSFRMAYSRTYYGTGYYIYHQFVPGIPLSQPIKSWDGKTAPERDVLELIARAGTDLVPRVDSTEGRRLGIQEQAGNITVPSKGAITLANLVEAPTTLRALEFDIPQAQALEFGRARLRITWDGRKDASVETPLALFFGAGTLYNSTGREYLVKGFPVYIRYAEQRVHLACFFPMPFWKSARVELENPGDVALTNVQWSLRFQPCKEPASQFSYFHATYRDHAHPERGKDLVLLDTREAEGGGDWSGNFIGTSFVFSDRAIFTTLEGDPRFFFDDSQTPQAYGTGTEEWGGGGDYWGRQNMTLPFAGHPVGARDAKNAKCDEDKIESAYRFLLADLMPFGKNARIQLEHGGENNLDEHYQTVTYWYGRPGATLVKTDEVKVGDVASETAHRYVSPQASAPYEINSRYEWGVDSAKVTNNSVVGTVEIYPAHTNRGRKTTGTSEFTLRLDPKNLGVMLRRKLDYSFPNQRAEVFIADETGADWKPAGIWYLAGANTCVYSNFGREFGANRELGATRHIVQTSNRRFRDDEFLLPRDLTTGRSAIRVRVKFSPANIPLFPGRPLDEQAWSEIRYDAYCWVLPEGGSETSTTNQKRIN
jgi:hypothetical protein